MLGEGVGWRLLVGFAVFRNSRLGPVLEGAGTERTVAFCRKSLRIANGTSLARARHHPGASVRKIV